MSDNREEWQIARKRKSRGKKLHFCQMFLPTKYLHEQVDVGKLVKRIRDIMTVLRCEDYWHQWKEIVLVAASSRFSKNTNIRATETLDMDQHLQCVCFGLGSFSSCPSARYQLAMLLLLLDVAQIPLQHCSLYDPAFSSGEKDVLRDLGLVVLDKNEEGKHLATKPTLFYMMHCGKALYNNLLWRNWDPQHLSQMMIIGNSFGGIREITIERDFKKDYKYLNEAVDLCVERHLPCPLRVIDVFSNTSVITFHFDQLNKLPSSSWSNALEPQYDPSSTLEIVQNKARDPVND